MQQIQLNRYELDFDTSYNQFFIVNKEGKSDTDSTDFWTAEAFEARMAIGEGLVGIGTQCYGPVKASLIIQTQPNDNFELDAYDHIVEGSLKIHSGVLQVLDCPNSSVELEVKVPPGNYRVRVYSSNLASVNGDEGDDFYQLEVWPDTLTERKVIKKYS